MSESFIVPKISLAFEPKSKGLKDSAHAEIIEKLLEIPEVCEVEKFDIKIQPTSLKTNPSIFEDVQKITAPTGVEASLKEGWPVNYDDMILQGNTRCNIGIATLWSEFEPVAEAVGKENYNLCSYFRTPQGIEFIIRNIIANPIIDTIFIYGRNLNHSKEALEDFMNEGVEEVMIKETLDNGEEIERLDFYEIKNCETRLPASISKEAIETFRENVKLIDVGEDLDKLVSLVKEHKKEIAPFCKPEVFPNIKPSVSVFPTDPSTFMIKADYIGEAWLKIIRTIDRFGIHKPSQWSDDMLEVLQLVTVIDKEDPDDVKWEDYFIFTKEELIEYYPQVTTPRAFPDIHYTYGQRLFAYQTSKDKEPINQIQYIIDTLKKDPGSRRALASTWVVEHDHDHSLSPCLDLVQALIQDGKLYLSCTFRSNDMYRAWPRNAFALRKLQKMIATKLGLPMGSLTITSSSAHIYSPNFEGMRETLRQYDTKAIIKENSRGTLHVSNTDTSISVTHEITSGPLATYSHEKIIALRNNLMIDEVIDDPVHGFELGRKLAHAEANLGKRFTLPTADKAEKTSHQESVLRPTSRSGFKVTGQSVYHAWIKALNLINTFGTKKASEHSAFAKELMNLFVVISDECPDKPLRKHVFDFDPLTVMKEYCPNIDAPLSEEIETNYGQLVKNYDSINQVDSMITQLKNAMFSRRAVACTWRPSADQHSTFPPSLIFLQALVQNNKIHLFCIFRSNEFIDYFPKNAFGLRLLQQEFAERLGLKFGTLTINSVSSHIYDKNEEKLQTLLEKYYRQPFCALDPRGNVNVVLDGEELVAQHTSTTGEYLNEYRAMEAQELIEQLQKDFVCSQIEHAIFVGQEIGRLELELQGIIPENWDKKKPAVATS